MTPSKMPFYLSSSSSLKQPSQRLPQSSAETPKSSQLPYTGNTNPKPVDPDFAIQLIEALRGVGAATAVLEFLVEILIVAVNFIGAIGTVIGFDRGGTFLHRVHELEVDPRGTEASHVQGPCALDLGAVSLTELLHLVAALDGGFGRRGVRAASDDRIGDLLPVGGLEVATTKGVPLVPVSVDEGDVGGPGEDGEAIGDGEGSVRWEIKGQGEEEAKYKRGGAR
ncbi:hypothetical protein G2W53_017725 [Senna tora]|uniref:Uncharacterized protein n=1 Tax=Senna tora TaxID=362788 RepID=A0A834TTM5_9FABA|nr:hypothetical protein G2W53_017725 [Senna tora]